MRVLVTGSSGWLGRFLVPALTGAGHAVVGLDVAPGTHTDVIGSVADRALIDRIFTGQPIDAVIHAGALHKPDIVRYPRQAFIDVNVSGTLNLLEAAVAHGASRFVFTSTTSLMISHAIRAGEGDTAVWIDETMTALAPRNIYGVTKLAAERLCRLVHDETGLPILILRTSRFFPEDDDTHQVLSGENMKANELLHRRLTVEDAVAGHIAAMDAAPAIGFDTLILSAPTPFFRTEASALKHHAAAVIAEHFPQAPALYAARGWTLPTGIDRVYDSTRAERVLGFRCRTDFASVLAALELNAPLPAVHDARYVSPKES
jgi:nucleoside-diphosphate-sugar epimerase